MSRHQTRKLTFTISAMAMLDGEILETRRYSKLGPLVITKGVEGKREYVITHVSSGRAIVRLPKLAHAREVLSRISPLANWAQSASELESDATLRDACREVAREVRSAIYAK